MPILLKTNFRYFVNVKDMFFLTFVLNLCAKHDKRKNDYLNKSFQQIYLVKRFYNYPGFGIEDKATGAPQAWY